jgi:hypothetical protein
MDATARIGRAVLYPDAYAWYILASALDIMVTHTILYHFDGREVNALAAELVERFGHWGLIGLKFASVIVVVAVCETVGRTRPRVGLGLAVAAIVVGALPVGIGLLQLAVWIRAGAS